MILEIDTKFLLEHKITAHQFLLVKFASEGDYDAMKNYLHATDTYIHIPQDMIALYNAGLLKQGPSGNATFREIKPSERFIKLMAYTGDPFDEFYQLFPTKVLRPDGSYDYLRVDRERCRKIYHNAVRKNKTLHDHIMSCLQYEVMDRKRNGQMPYFKRMPTWLSSEEWKVTSEKLKNYPVSNSDSTDGKEAYGTEIE